MNNKIIHFKNVSETYKIKFQHQNKECWETIYALDNISFSIDKGEAVAIIGPNGSGKTTLLKVIAGMLKPSKGIVTINGCVSGILDIGAGFHPEFTGIENIYIIFELFGISRKQTKESIEEIIDFAGIGKFINAPVKYYSQGMFVRLGFAIASFVTSDIIIIDDTLSVGDKDFQVKSLNRIKKLNKMGKTILFVTHHLDLAQEVASRSLFIKEGKLIASGSSNSIINMYVQMLEKNQLPNVIHHLSNEKLHIIVKDSLCNIYWDNIQVTSGKGLYFAVQKETTWFFSNTAVWSLLKKDSDSLLMSVNFVSLDILFYIKIDIVNKQHVHIIFEKMTNRNDDTVSMQIGLMCSSIYNQWMSEKKQISLPFPDFNEVQEWREIESLDSHPNKSICLFENNTFLAPAVGVSMIKDNSTFTFRLLNSIKSLKSRVIQYIPETYNSFTSSSFDLVLCKSKDHVHDFFRKTWAKHEYGIYLQKHSEVILDNEYYHILIKNKKMYIEYNKQLLSSGDAFYTIILEGDTYYHTWDAQWFLKKTSKTSCEIIVSWETTMTKLLFQVQVDNHELSLNSKILSNENTKILRIETNMDFDKSCILQANTDCVLSNKVLKTNTISSFCIQSIDQKIEQPYMFLKIETLGVVHFGNNYIKYFSLLDSRQPWQRETLISTFLFSPVNQANVIEKISENITAKKSILSSSMFELVYEDSFLHIFSSGVKLTTGLGVYTAFLFDNLWYDSTQAFWTLVNNGNTYLEFKVLWSCVPLQQVIVVSLDDEKISLNVKTNVMKSDRFQKYQLCCMISDEYDFWHVANKASGSFFDYNSNVNWERVYGSPFPQNIGVSSKTQKQLPLVSMQMHNSSLKMNTAIETSANDYNAAVMQYFRKIHNVNLDYIDNTVTIELIKNSNYLEWNKINYVEETF